MRSLTLVRLCRPQSRFIGTAENFNFSVHANFAVVPFMVRDYLEGWIITYLCHPFLFIHPFIIFISSTTP
jgi:hypothetical protein